VPQALGRLFSDGRQIKTKAAPYRNQISSTEALMKHAKEWIASGNVSRVLILVVACSSVFSLDSLSQSAGNHAFYNPSTGSTGTTLSGSAAYIDVASAQPSTNICSAIYNVLSSSSYPGPGTVVDARGVTSLSCSASESPWYNGTSSTSSQSDILLPAGTIVIEYPWIIPSQTRIFGEGESLTTIQAAASPSFSGSKMLLMGANATNSSNTTSLCTGNSNDDYISFAVGISDLTVDGNSNTINGIENCNAEEGSYVERVNIMRVAGTGLYLGTVLSTGAGTDGTSNHSGPYNDLIITAPTSSSSCIDIFVAQPRGVHGITCTSSSTPAAGIYLDGSNVSLEDINISGFTDGILVGSAANSSSSPYNNIAGNVLFNVNGGSGLTNVVHICKTGTSGSPCASGAGVVSDLSIMGLTSSTSNTLKDDLTGQTFSNTTDPEIGMYILGESASSGYTRFTTSPSVPTWFYGSGSSAPSGSCGTGSLFSYAGSAGTKTLFGCAGGSWNTGIK
jgi:hypothetical protein